MDLASLLDPAKIAQAVAVLAAVLAFLKGLHMLLGWLKGKTASQVDDKLDDAVSKAIDADQKALDFIQGKGQKPPGA